MTATTYAIALSAVLFLALLLLSEFGSAEAATYLWYIYRALMPLVLVCAVGFDLFLWAVTNG